MQVCLFLALALLESTEAVLQNAQRDAWISLYHRQGYSHLDICGFLLLVHNTVVSLSQMKRILRRLGLKRRDSSSPLRDVIREIRAIYNRGFADCGYKTIWRMVNTTTNVKVTQETTRLVLKAIDPAGVTLRSAHRLRRRTYINKGPNFAIHIDGYDKLKPFGIPIHGAIDGFSRYILWLEACHTNNDPRIIAGFFVNFLKRIGRVPRLVRGDAGTENVTVRDLQTALRYDDGDSMSGMNSFITGRSTANQRIERFWVNLRHGFAVSWRNYFKDMVERGLLRTDDPVHLECLRYCFLPLIQRDLDSFKRTWNLHRIRQQRHTEVPSGIPTVMYYQPEAYETRDYSYPLPCDMQTINRLQEIYTVKKPQFGCSDEFIPILEYVCEIPRQQLPVPKTVESATSLFQALTEKLDDY